MGSQIRKVRHFNDEYKKEKVKQIDENKLRCRRYPGFMKFR